MTLLTRARKLAGPDRTIDAEKVKRVALAIAKAHGFEEVVAFPMYAELARAAIEAMYDGWQPIETAPVNGQYILILCEGAGIPAIARFEHESRMWTALGAVDSFNNPVYWMQLPESPNVKLTGRGTGS